MFFVLQETDPEKLSKLLTLKPKQMKELLKNIFAKTPKRGKTLTKIGLGIGAIGLGLEFDVLPLENLLTDEKYIFWLLVIKYVCMTVGTFLTGAGLVQTEKKEGE